MTIYLATGLKAGDATPMEDEQIEARWFTQREIERLILSGRVDDAKTITGFFLYRAQRRWKISTVPSVTIAVECGLL